MIKMASVFRNDLFKGKVVFCTGGATGIGFGMCTQFGLHGAQIAIMGRRAHKLEEAVAAFTQKGIVAVGFQGDVRKPELLQRAVDACIQRFGRIDILVNNAAGNFMCSAEELSPKGFGTVVGIDLLGAFNTSKAVFPHLKKAGEEGGGAIIINITATLQYTGSPFQVHAASAKAGIDSMTRTLGVEWGEYGIRVVGIAPGPIKGTVGGPGGRVFKAIISGKENKKQLQRIIPLGRYGTTNDISNCAMFLASPAGEFITSETVVVDGGQWHGASMMYHGMKDLISKNNQEARGPKPKL